MNKIESDFVKPFYLDMMGLNALRITDESWASLLAAGRKITAEKVSWMLRTGLWRPVVMGAWFSVAVPAESIRDDLIAAMSQSQGSLTAPPLAATATVVAGPIAVPAMIAYLDYVMAPTQRDGSEDVVAAAVEYLGAEHPHGPRDRGRRAFHDIHTVAMRLHEECRAH